MAKTTIGDDAVLNGDLAPLDGSDLTFSDAAPPVYNLINDYKNHSDDDGLSVTSNPYWILLIMSVKYKGFFDHGSGQVNDVAGSFDKAAEIDKWTIITNDCVSLSISTNKSSYVSQLSATLLPSNDNNYLYITPGDYILAWMFNNEDDAAKIAERLNKLSTGGLGQCNGFMDGLKFVGNVYSIQKNLSMNELGHKSVRYALTANSFNEFSASFYYDKNLMHETPEAATDGRKDGESKKQKSVLKYLADVGLNVTDFISTANKDAGIPSQDMVIALIDLLIGTGINANMGIKQEVKATAGLEFDHSYIKPSELGTILGKPSKNSYLRAADLIEIIAGVQQYAASGESDTLDQVWATAAQDFSPLGTQFSAPRRSTSQKVVGTYPVTAIQFDGCTVWELLNRYVNPSSSEMYATLRANPDGEVVPTVVLRQLPFTTDAMADNVDWPTTKYTSLPRWIPAPQLVISHALGRNDAMRKNFVHVVGWAEGFIGGMSNTDQLSRFPAMRDEGDIARNGLRPYIQKVPCSIPALDDSEPIKWIRIIGDIVIGQHLLFSGQLELAGVQSPICIGDNLVFDDILYHIEGVTHHASIDYMGKRQFRTTLTLTHGVGADYFDMKAKEYKDNQRGNDPAITSESK